MRSLTALERAVAIEGRGTRAPRKSLGVLAAVGLAWIFAPGLGWSGAPGPEDDPVVVPAPADSTEDAAPHRVTSAVPAASHNRPVDPPPRPILDPSARLLRAEDASETWTLFVELESGHRITQRFLLSNQGPGKHNAVAVGHFVEPGRAPYRYVNGRRRARWKLSDDRLFFDIGASHLDLHRPKGELRITKDDIEIRLFFDFRDQAPAAAIPPEQLPPDYHVEVLALGADTRGSVLAPWMTAPLETRGRTWLVHTWSESDEQAHLDRRVEFYAHDGARAFYAVHFSRGRDWQSGWSMLGGPADQVIESAINVPARWTEYPAGAGSPPPGLYPTPSGFAVDQTPFAGSITLTDDWLRFDPLEVIPQPFRWFIRRKMRPQEVWADAKIGVSLFAASEEPLLPRADASGPVAHEDARGTGWIERTESSTPSRDSPADRGAEAGAQSSSQRETDDRTATGSVKGVSSITFLNPRSRR